MKKIFSGTNRKQCTEFGLMSILVVIFLALYFKQNDLVKAAFVLTLLTITFPNIFYPFAAGWFGLSKLLAILSSNILMTIVFFVLVTPVGLFRRLLKKDSLKLGQFKKSSKSVMIDTYHLYTDRDLKDTF